MRVSGGVYLTPAARLSSTARSVAIMLASLNTQTLALCCVSWIFFFARCQSYCTTRAYARLRHGCCVGLFTAAGSGTNHTVQIKSEYNGKRINCKKMLNLTKVNQEIIYFIQVMILTVLLIRCTYISVEHFWRSAKLTHLLLVRETLDIFLLLGTVGYIFKKGLTAH